MESFLASSGDSILPVLFTKNILLAYASKDLIALVDASSLNLVTTLAFWDVYPSTYDTETYVRHIAVDVPNKLMVAASGSKIAVWTLSSLEQDAWRVHSSLITHQPVTSLTCHSGRLVVGTTGGLSLFTVQLLHDLPSWTLMWRTKTTSPEQIALSPSTTLLATRSNAQEVLIWQAASGRLVQSISHPRPVINVTWRSPPSNKEEYILYTTTSDAALRIFLPVLDTPRHLQLHATIDPFSFLPSSLATNHGSPVLPLSREVLRSVIGQVLRQPGDRNSFDDSQRRRLTELYEEGWDLFARILDDGSIVIQALANLDRRPPTLLKQFTLLHSLFNPPLDRLPTSLLLIPAAMKLTLVTFPPISTHRLLPLPFFDAKRDGLKTMRMAPESGQYGHLPIQRLSRSPEGHAVAVMRNGAAEVWKVKETGGLLLIHQFPTAKDTHVLVFHSGESIAIYDPGQDLLTVRMLGIEPLTLQLPKLTNLFLIPPNHDSITCLIGITETYQILQIHAVHPPEPSLTLRSTTSLPMGTTSPAWILPVDPMVWTSSASETLLTISKEGDLDFWAADTSESWRKTGSVRTGRENITRARCSSTKKSVLVVHKADGDEVSIWDSKESQFSSGLEYSETFGLEAPVNDLDWTATPDGQSILAIGFPHHILLIFQQRMTYFEHEPRWGVFGKIEIGSLTRYPIADSLWIAGAQLLTGAGHQLVQAKPGFAVKTTVPRDLFVTVARRNGPLPDYHPQMLLQCLLWEKLDLVKSIIVRLAQGMKYLTAEERAAFEMESMPAEAFLDSHSSTITKPAAKNAKQTSLLFDDTKTDNDDDQEFSRPLVTKLIQDLEEVPLKAFTANENEQLLVLLQATLDIDERRRALDADGLRYLISIRVFYLLNERISVPRTGPGAEKASEKGRGFRERIRYRDMVWAYHSQSQEVLLEASTAACGGKMLWSDARALGIFLWVNSTDTLKSYFETIARNLYMAGEDRDPTVCSLFYFALGKVRLALGLWRQAAWHPDHGVMVKFLANDFDQPRWKTAALKNAFALLGKRRFEMAAAFFLLGGSLRDAISVCLKQMGDFQLAVAITRIVEGENGPILTDMLKTTIIPMAFKEGNRWLGSWAFWRLNRRDLGVRILVTPLPDYANMLAKEGFQVPETGESNYDDPSLALLFSRLKSMSLQTIKGTSMIPGQQEFDFVLQIARVFCRMGCHPLALDLVTSWSFDPPELPHGWAMALKTHPGSMSPPISPVTSSPRLRRSTSRRRSVVIDDLDLEGIHHMEPVTPRLGSALLRTSSALHLETVPETKELPTSETPAAVDEPARGRTGLGTLMQSAKRDIQVPEFDMGAFF